ncbi:TPA: hypothetical protein ACN3X6_003089 [Vibrio cholerae]|nr:hypothetical protein [Vibrio cholerae]MCR9659072.1 hypothetical protein [Vibrio cholerae]MCR9689938.1 hypothetical protein [Vibrio cholerae]MCR9737895.1 hypothetical protein [Vibrio cholerae]MCR9747034.1 hypothetical protein [Vibrio cholerae]
MTRIVGSENPASIAFGIRKDNIVLEKLFENLEPWREESMVELVA